MTHWNHLEPFFKPLTVGSPPQLPLSNPYNNFTKTYVQKRKQEKPKTERVIQVDKESTEEAFTLCLSMMTSKQKTSLPTSKRWSNSFENPIIPPLLPYAPACQDDHLSI
jgi:hypothetical protein